MTTKNGHIGGDGRQSGAVEIGREEVRERV
jgi:hypothetical protein